jgi:PAS domain S-box-containing protein
MRLSWHPDIRTTWHPLTMVMGLLLLLTYLLFQSRTPVPTHDTHFHAALQAIALYDVQLTRDVLLARAGLLPHADSLGQTSRALLQALATLRPGSTEPSGDVAMVLRQQVDMLTTVVEQKLRLVEYFTADNALLQNSLLYVLHIGHVLPMQTVTGGQSTVGAEVGRLSHALLQLLQSPQSAVGTALLESLDRLPRIPLLQEELDLLATHGRRVVELLPQVDTLLRQLLSVPTTRHLQALHAAVVQYDARRAARAQVFRLLLYLVAIALLGSLLLLFTRLQAKARALRTSEEHFRAITDTASEAIISTDQSWTIVSWNAAATLMFGYEAPEALGTSLLQLLPACSRAALTERLVQKDTPGQPRHLPIPIELIGIRKDGSEFPLDISLSTWTTAQGTYVTGMIRDLTARKHLEEQTRQQELQLIQANKLTALGTLVSGVAHEVNNPNQLVLMNTQMLADTWDDAVPILDAYAQAAGDFRLGGLPYPELRDTLPLLIQDLHAGAQHIARIIDDLRNFARPCAHRCQEPVCLNDAVQHGVRLLRHLIQRKTTQFQVALAESLPPVWGDAQHLAHVVVNLVVNALEALPDAGCGVRVSTRYVPEDHGLILEVADQGVGIAPQHLARLCDPFFTTKAARGGTGLGLAITATLVHAHGGRLTFQSAPEQGTCVCVTLPAADSTLAAAAARSAEAR